MGTETEIDNICARLDRPLVLIGMPASGKTSLGRGVSHILNLPFIDLDRDIEATAGRRIATIFETDGEAAFRDLESAVLADVLEKNQGPCVISTGGGAVLRLINRELIFGRTCSIWVKASITSLLERTALDTHRPLLKNRDPEKVLRDLETARTALYQDADIMVDTDRRSPEQIIPEIITKIHERLSS